MPFSWVFQVLPKTKTFLKSFGPKPKTPKTSKIMNFQYSDKAGCNSFYHFLCLQIKFLLLAFKKAKKKSNLHYVRNVDSAKRYSETQNPSNNEQNLEFYNQLKFWLLDFSENEKLFCYNSDFAIRNCSFILKLSFGVLGSKVLPKTVLG